MKLSRGLFASRFCRNYKLSNTRHRHNKAIVMVALKDNDLFPRCNMGIEWHENHWTPSVTVTSWNFHGLQYFWTLKVQSSNFSHTPTLRYLKFTWKLHTSLSNISSYIYVCHTWRDTGSVVLIFIRQNYHRKCARHAPATCFVAAPKLPQGDALQSSKYTQVAGD